MKITLNDEQVRLACIEYAKEFLTHNSNNLEWNSDTGNVYFDIHTRSLGESAEIDDIQVEIYFELVSKDAA